MTAQGPADPPIDVATLGDDPYPLFRRLHADAPVIFAEQLAAWLVAPYDLVAAVLTDAASFTVEFPDNILEKTVGPMMLTHDGVDHRRHRAPFAQPLRLSSLQHRAADVVADISNDLIDRFITDGRCDLDERFSEPLALRTVAALLGIPVPDLAELRGWFASIRDGFANAASDPVARDSARRAFGEFEASLLSYLKSHNGQRSTIVGDAAKDNLTQAEVVSNSAITMFGGLETTAAMLSNTVWALLSHPAQWQRVRDDPKLLPNAVEEALRWESPVQTAVRMTTTMVTLGGTTVAPGEVVQCLLGAANRDPNVFSDPDRFDIGRPNANRNLSFARGPHFCLGAPLARLEGSIGLRILLERVPGLALDPTAPSAPRGHEFRSPPQLWVRW